MAKAKKNNSLVAAIVFGSLVIAAALAFLALKLGGKDLEAAIAKGIDNYVAEQQQAYEEEQKAAATPKKVSGDFAEDAPFIGEEDAPVTIVEFSDFQCPYCQSFYENTFAEIKEKYVETGLVKFVYRDLPLSFHQFAYPAALFAECVRDQKGNEAYFEIHDEIFETIASGFDFEELSKFAVKELGINETKLKTCYDNDELKADIESDKAAAARAGISGTPGFVVNDTVISGAQPLSTFEAIIEASL